MSNIYVTRCTLNLGGQEITDFKAFSEMAHISAKMVPLQHKTGVAALTRRFQFTMTYVIPAVKSIDWESFVGSVGTGTCDVTYDSGDSTAFTGVSVIEVGEKTLDGENELVCVITFLAEKRNGEAE